MKKHVRWIIFTGAFIGMGMAMPSCPGQQELKTDVDLLRTANTDLSKKVQTLTGQVTSLNTDMTQVKQLLPQITNVIEAQKGALDRLDASIKALQVKPRSGGPKKRR